MRSVLAVAAALTFTGCAEARQLTEMASDPEPTTTLPFPVEPAKDNRVDGRDGGRYAYSADDTGDCANPNNGQSMPCRARRCCSSATPCHRGERSPMIDPVSYRCGPNSPSLAAACQEQPEYATFYGC